MKPNELITKLHSEAIEKQQKINELQEKIKKFDEWLMGEKMMFYKGIEGERLIRYYETQYKWKEIMDDSNE